MPLRGTVDVEQQAAAVPPSHVVKGMFFANLARILGPEGFEQLVPTLSVPPTRGRYLAFKDYPQSDYVRLSCAAAAHRFPGVDLREGMRRLAREDFDTFTSSTLGRVIMAVVRDPRTALLRCPSVYEKVAPGDWTIEAHDLEPGTTRIEFQRYPTDWAYTLGQLEGVVLHYEVDPETTVTELGDGHIRFDVRY